MSIYVKIDGVPGSATAKGYEKYFEALSMSFNVTRSVSMETGNMKNRLHGLPVFGEINLVKETDDSSSALLKQAVKGASAARAEVVIIEAEQEGGVVDYAKYELEKVIVSTFSMDAVGGKETSGPPTEMLALSYAKVNTTFLGHDPDNKVAGTSRVGYNLTDGSIV